MKGGVTVYDMEFRKAALEAAERWVTAKRADSAEEREKAEADLETVVDLRAAHRGGVR